jgi:UDP-GlcNAc:undecaprenyl-phosphate/decaprenyl-phosphate GlcNAc-1-phosphate transferase
MNGNLLQLHTLLIIAGGMVAAGATAYLVTGIICRAAHRLSLLDDPNFRSTHTVPTPRLGGVAIVSAFVIGMLYFAIAAVAYPHLRPLFFDNPTVWLLAGASLMALTGLVDDLKGLKPLGKLALQVCAAGVVTAGGYRFNLFPQFFMEWGMIGEIASVGLTIFWIVGVINAINLIDGLDGLAAGTSVIALSAITISMALLGGNPQIAIVAALIAAALGFLIHNSHPASIFMGDTGSLFLGFMLASASLVPAQVPMASWVSVVPMLALGLPILDTFVAMFRRARQGKGIFSPDRDHIHHRIASRLGYSHGAAVYALYAVSFLFGLASVVVAVVRDMALLSFGLATIGLFIFFLLVKLEYIVPSREEPAPVPSR